MSSIEERLRALEEAVARLQAEGSASPGAPRGDPANEPRPPAAGGRFWILDGLLDREPRGAVAFAGHVDLPDGEARWQWCRGTDDLLREEWDEAATPLAALGHPVRLRLLKLVLTGTTTTSELTDAADLGTTGQLHHHLRALVTAGWLVQESRGRYRVPAHRVVPLLVLVSATI